MSRGRRFAAWLAAVLFVVATAVFAALPAAVALGFSHRTDPVALLGAHGMPGATAFDVLGFVLPGLIAAFALSGLRAALPVASRWTARIGARMVLLSALAFALQGLLPLAPGDPDGVATSLHGTAWTLWWIAGSAGSLLLAIGLRGVREAPWPAATWWWAQAVPACALFGPALLPAGIAQRLAFLLWFAWVVAIARRGEAAAASVSRAGA